MRTIGRMNILTHTVSRVRRVALATLLFVVSIVPIQAFPGRQPPPREGASSYRTIPPHRAVALDGIHAYAQKSIAAGETVQFRVSSTIPYTLTVCKLGTVDAPETDQILRSFPLSAPRVQPIHPGSYVHVGGAFPSNVQSEGKFDALTLEVWIRPWQAARVQGLLTQTDDLERSGFALILDADARAGFVLGGVRKVGGGMPLEPRQWHHVAATWDGARATLWLNGARVASGLADSLLPSAAPFRLGAFGAEGVAEGFLDGDIALPAVYRRALRAEEIEAHVVQGRSERYDGAQPGGAAGDLIAFWPLDEEAGDVVRDMSGNGHDGRIIHRGTWMIGGPAFRGEAVPRFGDYDPRHDAQRGHGLRLASDDLYDCSWEVTEEFTIPVDATPGFYAGRLNYSWEGEAQTYDVTFIVRAARSQPAPPIAVLCSSSTWLAYSATPFAATPVTDPRWSTNGKKNSHPLAPAYSCYRDHAAGQPTYQMGLNMPWPVAGPEVLYSPKSIGYSHLARAERFAHNWLTAAGYAYDVVTDLDLHRDPDLLLRHKVLVINGHSEYWSIAAYEGVDRFLRQGGAAVVFSGNTLFWRVSFDSQGEVMECRKFDPAIGGRKYATVGELYHSHDGRRGSLLRECGYPAWKLVGLECIGWWGTSRQENYYVYETEVPDHFLFRKPIVVDVASGTTFGHAPNGGLPRAGGHEADVRLSTLRRLTGASPPGALFPEEPEGIVTLARMRTTGARALDYFARWDENPEQVVAEMIYWERPQGGRVFHAGTIASGWALSVDPKMQQLVTNVLNHFGVKPAGVGE